MEKVIDFIFDLDTRPTWLYRGCFKVEYGGIYLDIMFNNFHIKLYPDEPWNNTASCESGGCFGKADLDYAVDIMNNIDKIIELAKLEVE